MTNAAWVQDLAIWLPAAAVGAVLAAGAVTRAATW